MDAAAFVDKWQKSTRSERSAAQEHFLDLCELLHHPKPGDVDSKGLTFSAERRVKKSGGGTGFADFFKKGFFAWEYKKRGADLNEAFNQLLQYSGDLGNPPLLIASDMDRIEIKTRFTGFPTQAHVVSLDDFTKPQSLDVLRRAFFNPESLRPEKTIERITKDAAAQLAEIAPGVRQRYQDPTRVAHFLDRLIFCLFAEDVGLLPGKVFSRIIEKYQTRDSRLITRDIDALFKAMVSGGDVYGETIPHIDGNLFDDQPALELKAIEIEVISKAAALDWSQMDPSIFGTLFERVMDPDQRAEFGAHYTGFSDIATLVEPVVMTPLRREWTDCQARVEAILPPALVSSDGPTLFTPPQESQRKKAEALVDGFLKRLRGVRVLDPACGSGNFLYVTLRMLKDLEYQVLVFARHHDLPEFALEVGPQQLHGIEKNPYAYDLAQMTVWIGLLQWHRDNGFPYHREPVLQPLNTFEHKDAILDLSHPGFPGEPDWPEAEFLVGNPPFLGGKKMRTELGDEYVDRLFGYWRDRVRPEADLCCYWFEKARRQIEVGKCKRAGLLATQGIRGGASRGSLLRIKHSGDIFFAESDRPWVLEGANVHVSMIGFDDGSEKSKTLDGHPVPFINSNLTAVADIAQARRLAANLNTGFMGDTKGGSFDILEYRALGFMDAPNPNGRPNSDVIVPWINGLDVTRRNRDAWIIDFGVTFPIQDAAGYERPFEHVKKNVWPNRQTNKRQAYKDRWWIHVEPRPAMRDALKRLPRFMVTPRVAKHRLFVWIESPTLPDCQLIAFMRSDDYFFGVLHSRMHEVWARAQGTQVRERESGFRYTPTSCFETFPFPEPTALQSEAIAQAAKRLDELRSNWLNPPEWHRKEVLEFPGAVDGPWGRFVHDPDARGMGTVRYPRMIPKDAYAPDVARRTLTNLYNERPTWLDLAHRTLDEAVFAAYGWKPSMTDEEILAALLELNLERSESSEAVPDSGTADEDADD
jgi:hypothetical protein